MEFGCGTGRFAEELFEMYLSQETIYVGCDISKEMARLARERLTRYGPRASVHKSDGGAVLDEVVFFHRASKTLIVADTS